MKSFFFYDLETSGLDARDDRVMQFAGIRTDETFQPIGEPYNFLVTLADDTLPSPMASMVTGVTPQKTVEEGYSEADFARIFVEEICTPDTVILGFNTVRFDDEFMRALLWRNFYDPYEWAWRDGRSRWDMLDVVRMTRALRPDGINWPIVDGKPTNRLELLTRENGIAHENAHDALSDVQALIDVTKLIADKQPKLFTYLLSLRDKNEVKKLANLDSPAPFVYTSGRYDNEFEKTTIVLPIAEAEHGNIYVYDLRRDPTLWLDKTEKELADIVFTPYKERGDDYVRLPVKKLQYNRCPAVAPLGVLEQGDGWQRIGLDKATVAAHQQLLRSQPEFTSRVQKVLARKADYPPAHDAEGKLYDGFVSDRDKLRVETVRNADRETIGAIKPTFDDPRLSELFVHYKARQFPQALDDTERAEYETYRADRLRRQAGRFMAELQTVMKRTDLTDHQQYVCEELRLWFEAVYPAADDED